MSSKQTVGQSVVVCKAARRVKPTKNKDAVLLTILITAVSIINLAETTVGNVLK